MGKLLEIIHALEKEAFLSAWRDEERSRKVPDDFTQVRIAELAASTETLHYHLAATKPETLDSLIVGRPPGIPFKRSLLKQYFNYTPHEVAQLQAIKTELSQIVIEFGKLINSNYSLGRVYCPRRLVVLNNRDYFDDFGKDKLYAGNFHRFIAYAMWLEENPFQPIKLYYCEGIDCLSR